MNYKYLFKNIFIFSVCISVLGWGTQWFFNGLIDFSEWKFSQNTGALLGGASDNLVKAEENKIQLPYRDWQVEDLQVDSEAAISVEADMAGSDKILFKKNEQEKLVPASLVKLMTAIVSLENYGLSEKILISKTTDMKEDEQGFLIETESMSVENLLYIMLIESNNHAAYSLSQAVAPRNFIELMNNKAKALGLKDTYFVDSTGLSSENYSTAEDLAKLAKQILKDYPLIAEISKIKEFDLYNEDGSFYKKLVNTNKLLSEIPDSVGGKTGFTEEAKECLLLVVKNSKDNSYLINVVLGSDDRFSEMKKMIDWVEKAYVWQ